jgi:hypothetical protein
LFGLFVVGWGGGLRVFLVVIFHDVLHDKGDAAVGSVEWIVEFAEALIGESTDLSDLARSESFGLHEAAGGVGAVGRKFPIAVVSGCGVRLGVGVAFDGDFVRQLAEFNRQRDQ